MDTELEAQLRGRIAELEADVKRLSGDPAEYQLLRPLGFNPRQAALLVTMARQAPLVIPRTAIQTSMRKGCNPKSVDVLACKTRKVLAKNNAPGKIETIHGGGYRSDKELTDWVLGIIAPGSQGSQVG